MNKLWRNMEQGTRLVHDQGAVLVKMVRQVTLIFTTIFINNSKRHFS